MSRSKKGTRASSGRQKEGCRIVLTASKAEMSQYGGDPFKAFVCTFPQLFSRRVLGEHLVSTPNRDRTERFAPLGLRKVEAILADRFGPENVVVAHPDHLGDFIGSKTKVVGVTTMDPIGLAYVSTTYNKLIGFGGESLNAAEFKDLLTHPAMLKHKPKVVVGGAGVWQIRDAGLQKPLGIDVLFHGEGEDDIVPVFENILMGKVEQENHFVTKTPDRTKVPRIRNPSSYGAIEITRGCGRGCAFCSPTNRKKHSFPLDYIMKEVEVNVRGGSRSIFTVTEDMFLYRSHPGFLPNTPEIVKLYKTIASYPGVDYILLSHASLAPVLYDSKLLSELTPILLEKSYWNKEHGYGKKFVTAEVGIETGSARLMNKHMKGKALPYKVDNWSDLVLRGVGTMNDHDWWPLCTIMTGQPDETEDDVRATLELIDGLRAQNSKMFYTPVLFIPLEDAILHNAKRSSLESLTELQWEVVTKCWRNNIDFWQPDRAWLYGSMFFLSHWFYARWRHGKKSTRPMMHLAGLQDDSLTLWALDKWSNLRIPEMIGSGFGLLKNR
jgi:radical SAM superfamily enzyme YgiQ (UPF0313 family)